MLKLPKKKIIFKNEYAYLKKQVDKLDLEAIDYVIGKFIVPESA